MTWGEYPIAYLAGALTTLSPCVLPILPLVLGAALSKNRLAPLYVCLGLSFAFIFLGWSAAAFGSVLGISPDTIRIVSAAALGVSGLFFLSSRLSGLLSNRLLPISNYAHQRLIGLDHTNPLASLLIGFLLGAVWSPCSGPTLGVAVSLAAQTGAGLKSFFLMSIFSIGAVTPLLLFSYGAGGAIRRYRESIIGSVQITKKIFGVLMVTVSIGILTRADKYLEAVIVDILPDSWIDLTVRF